MSRALTWAEMIPRWMRVRENINAICSAEVLTNDGRRMRCGTRYQDADECPRAEKHVDDADVTEDK